MLRILRFLKRLLGLVLLLVVPALLIYLQVVGFGAAWRDRVAAALGGSVYTVTIAKLTFHPFEGIVAEGVRFHRRDATAQQVEKVSRIIVSPNLAGLIRGHVAIDRLELDDASVAIPFANDGRQPDTIYLRHIGAEIWNSAGQITISHAECTFGELLISLQGHLLNPETISLKQATSKPSTPVDARRVAVIREILNTLGRIQSESPKPELDIVLSGNLSQLASVSADSITLRTAKIRCRDMRFDRVNLSASYANRKLKVASLRARGPSGTINLAGEWDFASEAGNCDVNGGLALAPLLRLAGHPELAEKVVFDHPPVVQASVNASMGAAGLSISALGQASAGEFQLMGVQARSFSAAFAWKDRRLYIQDAVLVSRTGTVKASILAGPQEFRISLDSDASPTEFSELFGPKERAIIDLLEFKDPPKLHVTLAGTRPSLDALSGTGEMEIGRAAMRGSWIDSGKSDIVIADRAIVYKDLTIRKGSLRATGSFTYDFGRHEVRLDHIRCNIDPAAVLMWVDPRIAATVAVYRFRSPPDVRADGLAHMVDPTQNDLHIEVNAPGGLAYTLLNRDLVFGQTTGTVLIKGQHVIADVHDAALYGGQVALKADVSTNPAVPDFSVDVSTEHVDFPSLTQLYFGYSKSQGAMSGHYAFRANLHQPAAMVGNGSVRVEDGHVLAIPLFGPLSDIISTIIPGAGHESARLATADFTVAEQAIRTKNLEIQGAGFELLGYGSVGFPSGAIDLNVRINAKGIPGLVLFPVSKLFEYSASGTASHPQWRPKIIPREFFNVLGGNGEPVKKAPQP